MPTADRVGGSPLSHLRAGSNVEQLSHWMPIRSTGDVLWLDSPRLGCGVAVGPFCRRPLVKRRVQRPGRQRTCGRGRFRGDFARWVDVGHRETGNDRHLLKLLRALLRAAVMQDGAVCHGEAGTPQGGVVSPGVCNVYRHGLELRRAKPGAVSMSSRCGWASRRCWSFLSDWFSIWRIRSRVTLNVRPTSSNVHGCSPPRP
jgi:hypothetical protein